MRRTGRGIIERQLLRMRSNLILSARGDVALAIKVVGDGSAAHHAALGRLYVHTGMVPQRGLATPEAVGWERESGREPGYLNRRMRQFLDELAARQEPPCA